MIYFNGAKRVRYFNMSVSLSEFLLAFLPNPVRFSVCLCADESTSLSGRLFNQPCVFVYVS